MIKHYWKCFRFKYGLVTNQVTNSVELKHSWEADSCSGSEEISKLLWNLKAHRHVHKSTHFWGMYIQYVPFNIILMAALRYQTCLLVSDFPVHIRISPSYRIPSVSVLLINMSRSFCVSPALPRIVRHCDTFRYIRNTFFCDAVLMD